MSLIAQQVGRPGGILLEVGCGNAYGSAFLADRVDAIVASDLPDADPLAHAIGLDPARRLLDATVGDRAAVVGCSGERLPFREGSIGTVLMVFSLEHIPDKSVSVAEACRVLRPGGRLLTAVPTRAFAALYPPAFYANIAKRVAGSVRRAVTRRPPPAVPFRAAYPDFPLPTPHGAYGDFFEEFREQSLGAWVGRCEDAGLEVTDVVALSVIPYMVLRAVGGRRGAELYRRLQPLDDRLCASRTAARLAHSVCIVATKPERFASLAATRRTRRSRWP